MMSDSSQSKNGTTKKNNSDWARLGISTEQISGYTEIDTSIRQPSLHEESYEGEFSRANELYHQEQGDQPWWKSQFFISQPVLFGTWDGVFTSVMINIFGVIIFLRSGWIVAHAGIGLAVLIVLCTVSVVLISILSAIGICERCKVESGGVYFLLSHVLGSRIGGAVGLLYCFGQSVGGALCLMGFAESISSLITVEESARPWIQRAMATCVVILLGGLNLAGVKWVIKLQFLLLITLLLAALDFFIGSFLPDSLVLADVILTNDTEGSGMFRNGSQFVGWNAEVLAENTGPGFRDGETWFSVFGVFFPTVTGVMAGINMSGDLKNPTKDIPTGTLAALGVSTTLYLLFIIVLGATCLRDALYIDYLIVAKVSAVEVLLLAGLYISSLSSSLGTFYGTPRVLQSIAEQKVIPFIRVLSQGRGPNRLPIYALIVTSVVTLLFIWIGQLNTLAPIVTMPFLLTYGMIDYAYFALAQTFNIQQAREERFRQQRATSPPTSQQVAEDARPQPKIYGSGTPDSVPSDLDMLFPERLHHRNPTRRQASESSSGVLTSPDDHSSLPSEDVGSINSAESGVANGNPASRRQARKSNIGRKSRSWYSTMSNRWVSLFGFALKFTMMFAVNWVYALVCIAVVFLVWFYIGRANPGVNPGLSSEFRFLRWLRQCLENLFCKQRRGYEQIVIPSGIPDLDIHADQLTEENEDFAARSRYHQSSTVKGRNFDLAADNQEAALVP